MASTSGIECEDFIRRTQHSSRCFFERPCSTEDGKLFMSDAHARLAVDTAMLAELPSYSSDVSCPKPSIEHWRRMAEQSSTFRYAAVDVEYSLSCVASVFLLSLFAAISISFFRSSNL